MLPLMGHDRRDGGDDQCFGRLLFHEAYHGSKYWLGALRPSNIVSLLYNPKGYSLHHSASTSLSRSARIKAWWNMMIFDQGCLRPFFNRPVEVVEGVWRSNQPTPRRLQALHARGFKSVLNLRGESKRAYHVLEADACGRTGLQLHNLKMSSRRPPTVEQLVTLKEIFDHAPRPLLLHCKSGADRAGLVAGLFQLWSGVPIAKAKTQLSKRFLHFRDASTGVLDHFLEEYERAEKTTGVDFWEWIQKQYDRDAVRKSHRPKQGVSWWVDKVLRRE